MTFFNYKIIFYFYFFILRKNEEINLAVIKALDNHEKQKRNGRKTKKNEERKELCQSLSHQFVNLSHVRSILIYLVDESCERLNDFRGILFLEGHTDFSNWSKAL